VAYFLGHLTCAVTHPIRPKGLHERYVRCMLDHAASQTFTEK